MLLTDKMQIYPTKRQEGVLWALSNQCRLLYNWGLEARLAAWEQNKAKPKRERLKINYTTQQNQLPVLKKHLPTLKWVYSKALQMTLRKLDIAYKSFFALRQKGHDDARAPRFRSRHYFFTLCYNQSGFKVDKGILKLSHKHPSRVPLTFQLALPVSGNVKQVEIKFDSKSRWFASITYEFEPLAYFDNGQYLAIDPGVDNIVTAVNLQGKFTQITNKRMDKYWRPKIAAVQARRDRCQKKSRKWHGYNRKLAKMRRREANQRRDWQHFIAKVVVTNTKANTIIIGNPEPKKMASTKGQRPKPKEASEISPRHNTKEKPTKSYRTKADRTLSYSLQNTGSMRRFTDLLAYKAEKLGKRVIKVPEQFTTQICCNCGHQEFHSLSDRELSCGNCGFQIDRDENAAINIMVLFLVQKGLFEGLLPEPSVTEESFLQKWKGFLRYAWTLGPDTIRKLNTASKWTAKRKAKAPSQSRGWEDSQEAPAVRAG
ncbi:MAG: RNA-guided endonuclease InsQ/TnpB family protein [Candidatus Hodarchaeales archaeon]|jgi:putative transposase